jgi:hypothetical protein
MTREAHYSHLIWAPKMCPLISQHPVYQKLNIAYIFWTRVSRQLFVILQTLKITVVPLTSDILLCDPSQHFGVTKSKAQTIIRSFHEKQSLFPLWRTLFLLSISFYKLSNLYGCSMTTSSYLLPEMSALYTEYYSLSMLRLPLNSSCNIM